MTGHQKLIDDLEILLNQVRAFDFHDFKNTRYAMPKIELYRRCEALARNVKDGRYDNMPHDEGKS